MEPAPDHVLVPLLDQTARCQDNACHLDWLSADELSCVTQFLDGPDLASLELSCKTVQQRIRSSNAWHQVLMSDHGYEGQAKSGDMAQRMERAKLAYIQRVGFMREAKTTVRLARRKYQMNVQNRWLFWWLFCTCQSCYSLLTGTAIIGVATFWFVLPKRLDDSSYASWDTVFSPLCVGLSGLAVLPLLVAAQSLGSGLAEDHALRLRGESRSSWESKCSWLTTESYRNVVYSLAKVVDEPNHFWWLYAQYLLLCAWPLLSWLQLTDRADLGWSLAFLPLYLTPLLTWGMRVFHGSVYIQPALIHTLFVVVMSTWMIPVGIKADGSDFALSLALMVPWVFLTLIIVGGFFWVGVTCRQDYACNLQGFFFCICATLGVLAAVSPFLLAPLFVALRVDGVVDWEWTKVLVPFQILLVSVVLQLLGYWVLKRHAKATRKASYELQQVVLSSRTATQSKTPGFEVGRKAAAAIML